MTADDLITDTDTAALLHVSKGTLSQWRYLGTGPSYFKVGRRCLYSRERVLAWLSEQERQGTAEVAR